jgi:putative nucleotidyltransferase with HDIG domain
LKDKKIKTSQGDIMKENYRILIADDNESLCQVLEELLIEEGYDVTIAHRGDDALVELQRQPHHLALIDIRMPGLNGMEVLQEIKTTFPGTDVIIITSHASVDSVVEALRLGAQDYMIKPFDDLDIVSHVVRRSITKRRLQDENEKLYGELKANNIKLEESVKRLSSLNNTSKALHSFLELDDLLKSFVEIVANELEADRVSLMLLDKETNELLIEAAVGLDEQLVRSVRINVGDGIAGTVVKKGQSILVKDIESDPRIEKSNNDEKYNTGSFISAPILLSVPITYQQKTFGVINVNDKRTGGVFTDDDLNFVSNLASQAAVAIMNVQIMEDLRNTHFEAITALAEALEAKDSVTRNHSDRMLRFAIQIAGRLGLNEDRKEGLRYLAVLHDIGKIGIPEHILLKPGKLTDEEYSVMKQHPVIGAQLVQKVSFLSEIAPLIHAHHEQYDGNGYPQGLSGSDIPIESRIVSVLDAFDAMTSDRPYRQSIGLDRAIQELKDFAGSQFDPCVVEEFITILLEQDDMDSGEVIPDNQDEVTEPFYCESVKSAAVITRSDDQSGQENIS